MGDFENLFSWKETVKRAKEIAIKLHRVQVILVSNFHDYDFITEPESILKDRYIMTRYTCVAEVLPTGDGLVYVHDTAKINREKAEGLVSLGEEYLYKSPRDAIDCFDRALALGAPYASVYSKKEEALKKLGL